MAVARVLSKNLRPEVEAEGSQRKEENRSAALTRAWNRSLFLKRQDYEVIR